jgi:hypothetical protein
MEREPDTSTASEGAPPESEPPSLLDDEVLGSLRLLLVDDDPERGRRVVRALRDQGAAAVRTTTDGRGLLEATPLDPEVVLASADAAAALDGSLGRKLRAHPRLRWAGIVRLDDGRALPDPATGSFPGQMAQLLRTLVTADRRLERLARTRRQFAARVDSIGPIRTLRALARAEGSLRLTLSSPQALAELDLSDGLVAGATWIELVEGTPRELVGLTALAALLSLRSGLVFVERRARPELLDVMVPIEEAVASAIAPDEDDLASSPGERPAPAAPGSSEPPTTPTVLGSSPTEPDLAAAVTTAGGTPAPGVTTPGELVAPAIAPPREPSWGSDFPPAPGDLVAPRADFDGEDPPARAVARSGDDPARRPSNPFLDDPTAPPEDDAPTVRPPPGAQGARGEEDDGDDLLAGPLRAAARSAPSIPPVLSFSPETARDDLGEEPGTTAADLQDDEPTDPGVDGAPDPLAGRYGPITLGAGAEPEVPTGERHASSPASPRREDEPAGPEESAGTLVGGKRPIPFVHRGIDTERSFPPPDAGSAAAAGGEQGAPRGASQNPFIRREASTLDALDPPDGPASEAAGEDAPVGSNPLLPGASSGDAAAAAAERSTPARQPRTSTASLIPPPILAPEALAGGTGGASEEPDTVPTRDEGTTAPTWNVPTAELPPNTSPTPHRASGQPTGADPAASSDEATTALSSTSWSDLVPPGSPGDEPPTPVHPDPLGATQASLTPPPIAARSGSGGGSPQDERPTRPERPSAAAPPLHPPTSTDDEEDRTRASFEPSLVALAIQEDADDETRVSRQDELLALARSPEQAAARASTQRDFPPAVPPAGSTEPVAASPVASVVPGARPSEPPTAPSSVPAAAFHGDDDLPSVTIGDPALTAAVDDDLDSEPTQSRAWSPTPSPVWQGEPIRGSTLPDGVGASPTGARTISGHRVITWSAAAAAAGLLALLGALWLEGGPLGSRDGAPQAAAETEAAPTAPTPSSAPTPDRGQPAAAGPASDAPTAETTTATTTPRDVATPPAAGDDARGPDGDPLAVAGPASRDADDANGEPAPDDASAESGAGASPTGAPAPPPEEPGRDQERSDALVAEARDLLRDGASPDRIERLLQDALAADERNPRAERLYAEFLMGLNRADLALPHAERAVSLRRRRASYRILLGDVLYALGDRVSARSAFEKAAELDPEDPEAVARLSRFR